MRPRPRQALALASLAFLIATGLPAGAAAKSDTPIAGTALWIDAAPTEAAVPSLAAQVREANARVVYVKAADGVNIEAQFASAVASLRGEGLPVCAWVFAYGGEPAAEAQAAIAAAGAGASCLVVDAEGAYDGRYGAAQAYVHALRAALGASFAIALAGQAEVLQHPEFPYSVFLGPGAFNFDMPLMYWRDLRLSPQAAYTQVLAINAIYSRAIVPVGQLYGEPSLPELTQFRLLAAAYRLRGVSFFDLESAAPGALAAPLPRAHERAVVPATVRPGADGDEIVWAQELLNAAGAKLPVGGYYGAQTARAVAGFQQRHRLAVTGILNPATWSALKRLRAKQPSWAAGPPDSARGQAAGTAPQ